MEARLPPVDFVEARGLACVRGGRAVFRDVDFRVGRGQALLVEGPNGSGKTSLLRLLAGLLAPAAGSISFGADGRVTDREERGKFVGWLGHHDGAKPQLTAWESLRFFEHLYGRSPTLPLREGRTIERSEIVRGGVHSSTVQRDPSPKSAHLRSQTSTLPQGEGGSVSGIESLLELVGLSRAADLPCQYLSAGQKKRLALARLKLCGRPLWLLDEPLASLDGQAKSLLLEFVRGHLSNGGLAVMATHDPLGLDAGRLQLP